MAAKLLDVTQRAAMQAVAPHLHNLEQQNAKLRSRLGKEARHRLDQQVEAAVPNYREIDRDPAWHRWLLGIDSLTGRPRQTLLNDAISHGSAPRVREFFMRFQRDAGGTPANSAAYYGQHARSSGGPIYTRDQIAKLYDQHRRGAYRGRETEWARFDGARRGFHCRWPGPCRRWGVEGQIQVTPLHLLRRAARGALIEAGAPQRTCR
jgi:hypothetical protein